MTRQVALLRGINVGATSQVSMAALRAVVEGLGCDDVATHLRSGNVVCSTGDDPGRTAARLGDALGGAFGFEIGVVVRTAAEFRAVMEGLPFADEAARDPSRLQVVFLSEPPPGDAVAGLEDEDVGDDAIRLADRELYVWSPGGVAGSPALAALGRRRLPVVATARNWRTVTGIAAILGA